MKEAVEAKFLHQAMVLVLVKKANRAYSRGCLCSIESTARV